MPVLVKGVLTAEDARWRSSTAPPGSSSPTTAAASSTARLATAEALPEIVDAVEGRGAVLVDGGIRRGVDVAIALALGADAVLVGRPALWGLAAGGEAGAAPGARAAARGARADPGALRLRLARRARPARTCGRAPAASVYSV